MRVQDAAPPPTSLPSLSPGQSAAIGQGVTQAAVENAPGASIAAALRDSQRIGMGIAPALRAGDYKGAASAFVQSTAAALGAIPGVHLLPGFAGVIAAYHGSPHLFDEFKSSAIGTGEGAQAYGHGLYFAENPGVAESYSKIPNMQRINDLNARMSQLSKEMDKYSVAGQYRKFRDPRGEEAAAEYDRLMDERAKPTGALYSVKLDVNHDDLLDWDKPLSEQSPGVREKLAAAGVADAPTGGHAYRRLSEIHGEEEGVGEAWHVNYPDPAAASAALHAAGIPGIRYLDAGSRGRNGFVVHEEGYTPDASDVYWPTRDAAEKMKAENEAQGYRGLVITQHEDPNATRNVVMFDPSLIRIESVNGQPVPTAAAKASDGLSILAHPEAWGAGESATLYHGTTEEAGAAIQASGHINGPAYFTPRKSIAEDFGEHVVEAKVPKGALMVDLDLPGGKLLNVKEANDYLGNHGWSIDDYLRAGKSVGTPGNVKVRP